jgi:hypothetical protein
MKSIPASLVIVGVATLLAASISVPVSVSAADWGTPAEPAQSAQAAFPYAYAPADETAQGAVILITDREADPYRYTRERIWPGYGGAKLEHHFGMHPDDPERPRYRKYYPYAWGGYAFSAPYFVKRGEYNRPDYEKPAYGKAQKYRWGRDYKKPDLADDGRW